MGGEGGGGGGVRCTCYGREVLLDAREGKRKVKGVVHENLQREERQPRRQSAPRDASVAHAAAQDINATP